MNQEKFSEFLKIALELNKQKMIPLLMGSLGLEYRTKKEWNVQDIDIHVPGDKRGYAIPDEEIIYNWANIQRLMKDLGYQMIDLHEHEFKKAAFSVQFGVIDTLPDFAQIELNELQVETVGGIKFYVPTTEQYLKIYEASSKDSYRNDKNNNKDVDKIRYLRNERQK